VELIMEHIHKVTSSTITVQDGKDAGQTVEHIHCHVVPRTREDFDNDTIYQTLATHDKGPNVIWRPYSEMEEECNSIRHHILEHFSDMVISKKNWRKSAWCYIINIPLSSQTNLLTKLFHPSDLPMRMKCNFKRQLFKLILSYTPNTISKCPLWSMSSDNRNYGPDIEIRWHGINYCY